MLCERVSSGNTYLYLERYPNRVIAHYTAGEVAAVEVESSPNQRCCDVLVRYRSGEHFRWGSELVSLSAFSLYGIAISADGAFLFAQQDRGSLMCLELRTGGVVWKTKSKSVYSHIYVNRDTICWAKGKGEIQLIEIASGKVLVSHKVSCSNRFEVLDENTIINQSFSKRWEVLNPATLEVVESISLRDVDQKHRTR